MQLASPTFYLDNLQLIKCVLLSLEGFAAYYQNKGAKVGVYSTTYQWGIITGNVFRADSSLKALDSWLAGARSLSDAKSKCSSQPLTVCSRVALTQYASKNLDYDYSCPS